MIRQLRLDSEDFPWLFQWSGPAEGRCLDGWLARHRTPVPRDLVELWRSVGGGEMFETESIVPPISSSPEDADIEAVTRRYRDLGLPSDYLVFHEGYRGTAIDGTGKIIVFDPMTLGMTGEYHSLNDWYVQVIRDEYKERYGLPPVDK